MREKLELFRNCCRRHKLKVTPQRVEIYKTLMSSNDHPSAEVVCERVRAVLPNVSLDTVNRTLNTLSRIGAAFIVEGSGGVKRFDGNMDSHQHFKCIKCKNVFDFHCCRFDNIELPQDLSEKFKVLRATVYVEGLCEDCRNKENKISA